MANTVLLVSNNLLDTTSITEALGRDRNVVIFKQIELLRTHLTTSTEDYSVVVGYPLTPMTIHDQQIFVNDVAEVEAEFEHVKKCVIFGPHESMGKHIDPNSKIVCLARSVFFHDPAKWID